MAQVLSPTIRDYMIECEYSAEDEGYVAVIPDLEFCSAFGETAAGAVSEVLIAGEAWISAAVKSRRQVPPPSRELHRRPS